MTTAQEQYRALVAKLEAINPSVNEADDESSLAQGPTGVTTAGPDTTPAGVESPDILKQIEHAATFKEAYAMAVKAGLKKFKWCQCKEYVVKAAPKSGQGAQPAKPERPMQGYIAPKKEREPFVQTNPMGDFDPTQFSGQAAAPRSR